jgi:hypothetical protein
LLKREKVDAILNVFLLNYWVNHGFKLCQNNPWMSGLPNTIMKGGHQRTKESLVPIGPVVSEMKTFLISSTFFIFSNSD